MQALIFLIIQLSPKNLMSRLFGRIALMKRPRWWVKGFMHWFARRYRLRLDEAKLTFNDFENLDQMFTRELKEGLRPICGDIVHPADSKIAQGGAI
ncbi:MAG: hypothetical protein KDD34_02860, partial [Bdellovibrionales bacterium]|nr:hypothetical protein [Bdellovibrionales bacterium]